MKIASRLILVLTLSIAFSSSAQARGFFRVVDLSDAENVPGFTSPTDARGRFLIRTTFRGGFATPWMYRACRMPSPHTSTAARQGSRGRSA